MKTDIWVVCLDHLNEIGNHSKQLLYKASDLAHKGKMKVSAVCIGNHKTDILQCLSKYGADEVILLRDSCMNYVQIALILLEILQSENEKPKLIIFPASELGKCIAADLATRVGAGLTAECIDIEIVEGKNECEIIFTRAAINASVLAQIKCINTQISICTCKEEVFDVYEKPSMKRIPIREWKNGIIVNPIQSHIIESVPIFRDDDNIDLINSKLVFGVGRGIRDENGFELIEQVAKKYKAAIAGTRAIVEEGILDKRWQVGQSGISISPDIYIAIGISGATQHMVGVKNAKTIIAINTDDTAPIFAYANYCIVEDYKKIFKELI